MAPNDPWPPMASPSHSKGSGKGRGNNGNKKNNIKDHQQNVLKNLKEMFQSAVEEDVIVSVASSCNWEHQACIDALITISASVDVVEKNKKTKSSISVTEKKLVEKKINCVDDDDDVATDLSKMTKHALKQQQEELKKFEKMKKNVTKSRMGSFRGSISKLESTTNTPGINNSPQKNDTSWQKKNISTVNVDTEKTWEHNNPKGAPGAHNTWRRQNYQGQSSNNSQIDENKTILKTKNDSELCGLKVHYKTLGTDTSSDDDDADVVIEEEVITSDIPLSIHVNSSQFLSSTTSTVTQSINSQKTKPKIIKSPPHTPKITIHQGIADKIISTINRNEKILIFIRGLPGSGKTTLSKNLIQSTIGGDSSKFIFSADDYFNTSNGSYKYDSQKIPDAHASTQKKVLEALKLGITPIIIDNTNLQAWEMRPYATMAVQRGYIIEILDTDTPWCQNVNELTRKNKHNVPKEKIRIMMNRYEHGLTGQKLCQYLGLKYPHDNSPNLKSSPPVINEIDVLSAEDISALENLPGNLEQEELQNIIDNHLIETNDNNQYIDYLKELRDRKESQSSVEDSEKKSIESALEDHHFLVLGAIGSERKTSLVPTDITSPNNEFDDSITSDNNENLLSQCLDFTLTKDGETIHSCRSSQKSPVSPAEIQKQDKEFSKTNKKINKQSSLQVFDDKNKSMQHAVNAFLKELAEGYNKTQGLDKVPMVPKTSSVVITEIIEHIEKENITSDVKKIEKKINTDDTDSLEIENLNLNDQEISVDIVQSLNDEKEMKIVDNIDDELESSDKEEENYDDKNSSENTCEEKDSSFLHDAEEAIDVDIDIDVESSEQSQATSTIGSFLNLIKTSILRRNNEEQTDEIDTKQNDDLLNAEKLNLNSSFDDNNISQFIDTMKIISDASESLDSGTIDVPIAEIRAAIDSTDNDTKKIKIELDECDLLSLECVVLNDDHFKSSDVKLFNNLSDKNDEIKDIDNIKEKISSPKKHLFIYEEGKEPSDCDNINRITWKESPFPTTDIEPLNSNVNEVITNNVMIAEAETNTTYYDFNVAYVGGTSEPGYRVLNAFSRQINEDFIPQQPERPPIKLMLDKSSMTGGIYTREGNPESDDEETKKDRLSELTELLPHIPKDYLREIYEKVDKNFDWAVELLLDGVPEYISIDTSKEIKSSSSSISPEATNMQEIDQVIKDEDEKIIPEKKEEEEDEEEEELEESSSSTSLDMLLDIKIPTSDLDSNSTTSPISENLTKDQTSSISSDPEETMELNLGFDFIQSLEMKFGNADFHHTDGFLPVVQITKSMGETLYALWIESMCQQLNARQDLLDGMITKDADFARNLERQQHFENIQSTSETNVPNIDEILDMELALASVENERKSLAKRETNDDIILRLSTQILHDSHPDIDSDTFRAILDAHNGDYHKAFKAIELNTGKKILPCYIKKQKNLMDKVKKEAISPNIVYNKRSKTEPMSYKTALTAQRNSRQDTERQLSLRLQNINKAQEMYRKGLPEVAEYYSNLATLQLRQHNTNIINDKGTDDLLDLHYLTVADALDAVDEFIDCHIDKLIKSDKRSTILSLVTGWGARSHGVGKIKPAVMKHLTKRSIKFIEENPGCLQVTLRRKNIILD